MRTGITELSILICLAGFSIFLFGSDHQIVLAAPEVDSLSGNLEAGADDKVIANKRKTGVLLAQKKSRKKRSAKARKRILSDEKVLKSKKGRSKTNLDFDAVDISGQRKTPLGSMVGTIRDKKGGDFIQIRTRWHDEIEKSASNLD